MGKRYPKLRAAGRMVGFALAAACATAVSGCIGKQPRNPAATQPSTALDPKLADPAYWLAQPGTASVSGTDFDTLWNAAEHIAMKWFFAIDQRNYRDGDLSTKPMVSKQFFEPWRKDAVTGRDVLESSMAATRRTIHFQFVKNGDGTYTVFPKVLVEREAVPEPKYRADPDLPVTYWYATRRDAAMEARLAEDLRKHLAQPGT